MEWWTRSIIFWICTETTIILVTGELNIYTKLFLSQSGQTYFPILQYSCFLQTQTTRASDSIFNTHNPQSLWSVEVWETNADVGGVAAILQQQAEWNSEVIQNNDPNNTICYWVCIWWTNPMPHRTWFNWKTVLWSTHLGMIADILVWYSLSWLLWWASLILTSSTVLVLRELMFLPGTHHIIRKVPNIHKNPK